MNVAYFIYVGKYIKDDMFDVCIQSLKKVSDCRIIVYTIGLENKELLKSYDVEIIQIDKKLWTNRRMACKVECTLDLQKSIGLQYGDNVMVLDADLIFLKDPFSAFSEKFDLFYTTRHYSAPFKVNGGVWGFKFNKSSDKFLQYYISNLNNPEWPPYVNFRKNHTHNRDLNNLDWWVDQDWLCVCDKYINQINGGVLGFDIKLCDMGPTYNWIIRNGPTEVIDKINKKDVNVIHLKGSTFTRWVRGSHKTSDSIYKKYIKLIT